MNHSFTRKGNMSCFKVSNQYNQHSKHMTLPEIHARELDLLHAEYWEFIRVITRVEPYNPSYRADL